MTTNKSRENTSALLNAIENDESTATDERDNPKIAELEPKAEFDLKSVSKSSIEENGNPVMVDVSSKDSPQIPADDIGPENLLLKLS